MSRTIRKHVRKYQSYNYDREWSYWVRNYCYYIKYYKKRIKKDIITWEDILNYYKYMDTLYVRDGRHGLTRSKSNTSKKEYTNSKNRRLTKNNCQKILSGHDYEDINWNYSKHDSMVYWD